MSDLTEREKWLMRKAWVEAWDVGSVNNPAWGLDDWLKDMAADAVTVEMVLETEAPDNVELTSALREIDRLKEIIRNEYPRDQWSDYGVEDIRCNQNIRPVKQVN